MDASRFDRLARALTVRGTRRGLVQRIAGLPLLGGLAALLVGAEATAAGRRMRRKKRHKHGRGRRRGQRKKKNEKKRCRPKSRTSICAGRCGVLRGRCRKRVDCGPCPCDPPCREGCCGSDGNCQGGTIDSACGTSGMCVDCGNGRRCLEGACVCDSTSCPDGCCDSEGSCLPNSDFSCGTGGVTCAGPCVDDGANVDLGPEESDFLTLLNAYRAAAGLLTLTHNALLAAAAEAHSLDMATRGYFSHITPEGDGPLDRLISQGYDPDVHSENIAAGQPTAEDVLAAWQGSAGHDANMLDVRFTETGIGRAFKHDSTSGWYWTVVFASPAQH